MAAYLPRILLAFYWAAIFVGTHLPKSSMPSLGASDKLLHASAFAGLACLLFLSLPKTWTLNQRVICILGIGLTYAVFDEFTQGFVSGRETDWRDAVADMVGIVAILILIGFVSFWSSEPKTDQSRDREKN